MKRSTTQLVVFLATVSFIFSSCNGELGETNVDKKLVGTWDLIAGELPPDNWTNFREYWIFTPTNLMVYDYDSANYPPDLMGPFDWEYRKPNVFINRERLNDY